MENRNVNYLQEMAFILFSQKKVFMVVASVTLLLSLAYAILAPNVYMAQGSLLIRSKKVENSPDTLKNISLRVPSITQEDLYSEVEMLLSEDVLKETSLRLSKESILNIVLTGNQKKQDEATLNKWISRIRSGLKIQVVAKSRVIQIEFHWSDPREAQYILETVMEEYILYRRNLNNPSDRGTFFSDRVVEYLVDLKKSKESRISLFRDNKAVDPLKEIDNNLILRQQWQKRLMDTRDSLSKNEKTLARLNRALDSDHVQLFTFMENPSIQALSGNLQLLLSEQVSINQTFHEEMVEVIEINDRVDQAFNTLKREVSLQRHSLADRVEDNNDQIERLEKQIDIIDQRNAVLRRVDIENQELLMQNELISLSYKTFHQRLEESNLNKNLKNPEQGLQSYIIILSKAKAKMSPIRPRRVLVAIFGLFLSGILGFIASLFNNYTDHTFKRQSDVASYLDLPLIYSISNVQMGDDKGSIKNTPSSLMKRLNPFSKLKKTTQEKDNQERRWSVSSQKETGFFPILSKAILAGLFLAGAAPFLLMKTDGIKSGTTVYQEKGGFSAPVSKMKQNQSPMQPAVQAPRTRKTVSDTAQSSQQVQPNYRLQPNKKIQPNQAMRGTLVCDNNSGKCFLKKEEQEPLLDHWSEARRRVRKERAQSLTNSYLAFQP